MIDKIVVRIPREKSKSYPILIGPKLRLNLSKWLPKQITFNDIVIITDNNVKKYYGTSLKMELTKQGFNCLLISFPHGEKSKNIKTKISIEDKMLRHYCGRDTLILALGGGVVGDIAGFVAATYMRGIPYIQMPTTLLSMVDSSVGGKTGIDTVHGKNLIGAFYQPTGVVADIVLLSTLSNRNMVSGLAEAIKMFITSDVDSLHYTERYLHQILTGDIKKLQSLVNRAVNIKTRIIQFDEKENRQRIILNYGHTIGHALEHLSNYRIAHGIAIAYGILVESKISQLLGLLTEKNYSKIKNLIASLGLYGSKLKKFDVLKIIQCTKRDKKNQSGRIHYVLLRDLGRVHITKKMYAHPVADKIVKDAITQVIEG